ncbi:MAG: hypothetical protein M3142_01500 [Bacteroidota bacterium]|nr:hypothetical protein [Bacteroidota bacterium]
MITLSISKKAFGTLLGALFFCLGTIAQAQTRDSTEQKPQLNNELPGVPVPTQTAPAQPQPSQPTTPAPQQTAPTIPSPENQPEPAPRVQKSNTDDEEEDEKPAMLDRMFVGSTGGLGFGSNSYSGTYFNISLSPFVGYRILNRWAVGPGVTYEYVGSNGYHLSTYGGKLFTQVDLFKGILFHAEHEFLSVADLELNPSQQIVETRRNVSSTLAGGGYRQMNGNFGMDLYVLFNLNSGVYQYRSNPVIRVGFIYNLHSRRQ